jgi:hypothetical protein
LLGGHGHVAGAQHVHPVGQFGIALTAVHVGDGRPVNDHVRREGRHLGGDGLQVGDIVLWQIDEHELIGRQFFLQCSAQLPLAPGNGDSHDDDS